jgi:hypothetical protein
MVGVSLTPIDAIAGSSTYWVFPPNSFALDVGPDYTPMLTRVPDFYIVRTDVCSSYDTLIEAIACSNPIPLMQQQSTDSVRLVVT